MTETNAMNETNEIRMQHLKEIFASFMELENTRKNKMEAYTIVYNLIALPSSEQKNQYTNLQTLYSFRNNLFTDFLNAEGAKGTKTEDVLKRYNELVKFTSFVFRYLENLNYEIYKFEYLSTEEYSNKILKHVVLVDV